MRIKKWIGSGLFALLSLISFAQVPGTIGPANQTICYRTAPQTLRFSTLPSGGVGPYTFRWERSNDGTNFNAITGVTGLRQYYSPPILARSAWFRCRVTDANSLALGVTNVVSITVSGDLISGTIGVSQTISYGTTPAPLTQSVPASGGGGSFTYRWQSSGDGMSWTDIPDATSADYSPSRLFETTRYRRWTIDPMCGSLTGNIVTITVNTNLHHYDFNYPDRESLLADGWDFIARTATGDNRNTEQTSGAVVSFDQVAHPGVIRIPVDEGDVWEESNDSRNTLFLDLPSGWTSVRLKINSFEPTQDMQLAGMLAYQDDDNFVQIVKRRNYNSHLVLLHEEDEVGEVLQVIPSLPDGSLWLRMDYNAAMGTFFGYYSFDGVAWRYAGSVEQTLASPRLAIFTGSSSGGFPNADIEWAEISLEPLAPPAESLSIQPGALVFNAIEGQPISDSRSLFISSTLDRQVSWSRTINGSWLTTDLEAGQTEGSLKVSVNTSGLTAGTYQGSLTLTSSQVTGGPVTIPVTLIINPVGVRAATWRDGMSGAFSVSVDDGYTSGSSALSQLGLAGTYVYIGDEAPFSFTALYNAGMELGCHTTNSLLSYHPDNAVFRSEEILPNINGLTELMPESDIISFVWPFGGTNLRLQSVVADYFLSARGYNINQLEDASPENLMNLKSFNSIEDPNPPSTNDFRLLVDSAVAQSKWFNLVLHSQTSLEAIDAINHAASLSNVWTAPIGSVVKYIMQRDRFILTNYDRTSNPNQITFNVSRLAIPSSSYRSFETAFKDTDITTLDIDINHERIIDSIFIDDEVFTSFQRFDLDAETSIVRLNVRLQPGTERRVRIEYYDPTLPRIFLNANVLSFLSDGAEEIPDQNIQLTTENLPEQSSWSVLVNNDLPAWLQVSPLNGQDSGTLVVSVDDSDLANGDYIKQFSVIQQDAVNSPVIVTVNLTVSKPLLSLESSSLNFIAEYNSSAPSGLQVSVTNTGSDADITWSCTEDIPWLEVTPLNGTTPEEITINVDQTGLDVGVYRGVITVIAPNATNSPQEIAVSLRVHDGVLHYDFDYPDRVSLIADDWDFIARTAIGGTRNTEQSSGAVVSFDQNTHPGVIRIPVDEGDIWEMTNNSRNTLFLDLPPMWTSIRMKIASFVPTIDMQQAGLLVYQDDDNYVQISKRLNYNSRIMFIYEDGGIGGYDPAIPGLPDGSLWLRLDINTLMDTVTGYYSIDGISWLTAGTVAQTLANPLLAIFTSSSSGGFPNADIEWVEISLQTLGSGARSASDEFIEQDMVSLRSADIISNNDLVSKGDKLDLSYPNPFSDYTTINFSLAESSHVSIEIFNYSGNKVETLINREMSAGNYSIPWNASGKPNGIYYISMKTGSYSGVVTLLQSK